MASWSCSTNRGCPQWDRLTKRHAQRSPAGIKRQAAAEPAAIFASDLLWLNGAGLRPRPLLERKDALYRTVPANRRIRYARHVSDSSAEIWQMAVQLELEGLAAKDAASFTRPAGPCAGSRSRRKSGRRGSAHGGQLSSRELQRGCCAPSAGVTQARSVRLDFQPNRVLAASANFRGPAMGNRPCDDVAHEARRAFELCSDNRAARIGELHVSSSSRGRCVSWRAAPLSR
jgi:hypothetical protein